MISIIARIFLWQNQKWLSTVYMEQLKPGSHPWDESVTSAPEIIEKYCNEEYYHHWLANKDLHKEEKEKAVIAGYTEIFPSTKQPMSTINKALDQFYQVGKKSLEENDIALIKTSANAKIIEAFTGEFKIAYKSYFNYDYVAEELASDVDIPKWDLRLLYTFFASDHFKQKTIQEFIKSMGYVQTKVKDFCNGKDFIKFVQEFYKVFSYITISKLFCSDDTYRNLRDDFKNTLLRAIKNAMFSFCETSNSISIHMDLLKSNIVLEEDASNYQEIYTIFNILRKIYLHQGLKVKISISHKERRKEDPNVNIPFDKILSPVDELGYHVLAVELNQDIY